MPHRAYRGEGHSTSSANGDLKNDELQALEDISNWARTISQREEVDGEEPLWSSSSGHVQLLSPEVSPQLDTTMESDDTLSDYSLSNGRTQRNGREGRNNLGESDPPTAKEPPKGLGLSKSSRQADHGMVTIEEEFGKRRQSHVKSPRALDGEKEKALKLSPAKLYELTSSPESLPLQTAFLDLNERSVPTPLSSPRARDRGSAPELLNGHEMADPLEGPNNRKRSDSAVVTASSYPGSGLRDLYSHLPGKDTTPNSASILRPRVASRTVSTPPMRAKSASSKLNGTVEASVPKTKNSRTIPAALQLNGSKDSLKPSGTADSVASPMPSSIPIPPLSIPTYLQLELSSFRPSPLYIHRSATSDIAYESSRVKIERLQNFLLLPPQLEQVLWFGALACLDAWLYSFTILPLRFLKAVYVLSQAWGQNTVTELDFLASFVYAGTGRMWRRRRRSINEAQTDTATGAGVGYHVKERVSENEMTPQAPQFTFPVGTENPSASYSHPEPKRNGQQSSAQRHRRSRSTPSLLLPDHKADILKGLLIIISCTILMRYDASRMYHSIRGQAAIKLYVIYNVLEVSCPGEASQC